MHRSKLPLTAWFWAAHLMATHSNGMSARQLEDQLGVTYKTAWLLTQKLRRSMVDPDREPLEGVVEVDQAEIPFREGDAFFEPGNASKILVIGAVEVIDRDVNQARPRRKHAKYLDTRSGRIRLAMIANNSAKSIEAFVKANVKRGTTLITDGHASYPGLAGYRHDPRIVGKMAGHIVLPWIHRALPIRLLPTPTTCRVLPRDRPSCRRSCHGRHAGCLAGHQIGRPKPYAQRRVRARHDRSHRQSGVTAALAAAQDARTICEAERLSRRLTMGANEPVAPASLLQVAGTGRIVREKSLELWQRLWEPKIATLVNVHEHGRTLPLVAVGDNRIGKHRAFSLMKRWSLGTYHGLRRKHVDTYLNEFVFRYNRRFHRHVSFEALLGLAAHYEPASYWDIVKRDNPRKRAETLRRAPRRSKTATGMRQDCAPPAQGVRRDQPIKPA